jgi:hypothetical protein
MYKITIYTEQNRSGRSEKMAGGARLRKKINIELPEKFSVGNTVEEITAYRKY